ncbi:MAG: nicotinamide-nucleotide adenylyltransferase [Candidatus Thermoplasmatota archaeon]|mgnify:FL=1
MPPSRALFIGRFQPFHNGHLIMAKRIRERHDELIIGIGSAQYSHTGENPFTAGERYEMIHRTLDAAGVEDYNIVPIPDTHVHSVWVSHILSLLPAFESVYTNSALVIRLFKERRINVVSLPLEDRENLSGTEIRRRMLKAEAWRTLVPTVVGEYIDEIDGVRRIQETHRYSTPYGTKENAD